MDQTVLIITIGLLILAVVSGMVGLGVAFAAVPFLSLFMTDLVHQVQPLTLMLNGLTALFATLGFARSGYVDWRKAIILAVVTTLAAPAGAFLAQFVDQQYILYVYLAAVIYLAYRLFAPAKGGGGLEQAESRTEGNFRLALILAVPISILAGFLGIGPGFLLMPTLILLGFEAKQAAGINAFAVTPPSFSALIPHLGTAVINVPLTITLLVVGAIGAFAGARITSLHVPGQRLRQLFGVLIVVMTLYKIYTLVA
ncbi:MAG: sulfite exporter TauE/SafE family protein [Anaerolineae bacterium]